MHTHTHTDAHTCMHAHMHILFLLIAFNIVIKLTLTGKEEHIGSSLAGNV